MNKIYQLLPTLGFLIVLYFASTTKLLASNDTSHTRDESNVDAEVVTTKPLSLIPYNASYEIIRDNKTLGHATRKLSKLNEQWQLTFFTSMKKWFYKYQLTTQSTFIIDNNAVQPQSFYSKTKRSFKKDRLISSDFNWQDKVETGRNKNNTWSLPLNNELYDNLSFQVALRLVDQSSKTQTFNVSYKGIRLPYLFINQGTASIDTAMGKIDTILWEQQTASSESEFIKIWLAPKYQYLPVQIAQYDQGQLQGTIRIESIIWDGNALAKLSHE
ncbi:MAG: DUF3108 domain-containing protein [Kangiellaceae bacterium]|jgi:hypothetical protein|nr:DUF3108 domain-containing protein [Kangiellaceae bacterium]